MSLLLWIIFGLVIGVIAYVIDPRSDRGGILGSMILGILGSVLGGFLGNIILGINISGFNFPSLAIAVLGSLSLLLISRMAAPKI